MARKGIFSGFVAKILHFFARRSELVVSQMGRSGFSTCDKIGAWLLTNAFAKPYICTIIRPAQRSAQGTLNAGFQLSIFRVFNTQRLNLFEALALNALRTPSLIFCAGLSKVIDIF